MTLSFAPPPTMVWWCTPSDEFVKINTDGYNDGIASGEVSSRITQVNVSGHIQLHMDSV